MYKVILMNGEGESGKWILRQTAGSKGISNCGKYKFYVNEIIPDPDFVIVRGKSVKNEITFNVAPENLILTTSEPLSVLAYPSDYCRQFGLVCSCQEGLKHRNVIYTPAILQWFVGASFDNKGRGTSLIDYDTFKAMPTPKKTKLISVIGSNKAFTQGHLDRIRFVERLKEYYGDKMDVFGRGYNGFNDKWDVLSPYKYHIVIENSSTKYYWTEKLSDCFMAETYPIYYGCTNAADYFPKEAFTSIDINNFDECVKTIDALIASDAYEEAKPLLKDCKELVLEDYNMFNYLASILDKMDASLPRKSITIKPANSMHSWHNVCNYIIKRNVFKMKRSLATMFKKRG
jgi:hypothetical protein